jgi:hypothetical protein
MYWFHLVENICAKYSIVNSDFYNFDEIGFVMGMIQATLVVIYTDWIAKSKTVQPGT